MITPTNPIGTGLVEGEEVTLSGVVGTHTRGRTRAGASFVKAQLTVEGATIPCVWWNAAHAPPAATSVIVTGQVHVYEGRAEVSVSRARPQVSSATASRLQRLLQFYIDCVEAEGAQDLSVTPGAQGHLLLESGPDPAMTRGIDEPYPLPREARVERWARARLMAAGGETVLVGFPVVSGEADRDGEVRAMLSPLCIAECLVARDGSGGFQIERVDASSDVNAFSLELLGVSREERNAYLAALAESDELARAGHELDRIRVRLEVLQRLEVIDELPQLNPEHLETIDCRVGIQNAALILVAERSAVTRMLLQDLGDLAALGDAQLGQGPLGIALGERTAAPAPPPQPLPTLLPSNLSQDRAVTAAMSESFTVLTGPPGTGKSQVVVNAVAAAVANGETVLLASKNNQAVDVVFGRLGLVVPGRVPLRAGRTSLRGELARSVAEVLAQRTGVDAELGAARAGWSSVAAQIERIHAVEAQRAALLSQIGDGERAAAELSADLSREVGEISEPERVTSAVTRIRSALAAFSQGLGFVGRGRRHRARLEEAHQALQQLQRILGSSRGAVEAIATCLAAIEPRSIKSTAPSETAQPSLDLLERSIAATLARQKVARLRAELDALAATWVLDDRLRDLEPIRLEAGRKLVDAVWTDRTANASPDVRGKAGQLRDSLETVVREGRGANAMKALVPRVLPMFPVWAVTNLSARTNLPLTPKMFDLLIIDEASQCDIPSALPLLFRAKRALIIGDSRQLIHVTSLRAEREQQIARRHQLDDAALTEFGYRARSCFRLASNRVGEAPLLLDQHFRSHPAIITFSNDRFYGARLDLCSDPSTWLDRLAIEWIDVRGRFERGPRGHSARNVAEARALVDVVAREWNEYSSLSLSLGVVSPFRAQVEAIREGLAAALTDAVDKVTVDTAHRFQGDERDIIFLSPVVAEGADAFHIQFASNPNLMNVAITRARKRLVIVGDYEKCRGSRTLLAELARYVDELRNDGYRSPIEQRLGAALRTAGLSVAPNQLVAGHRLDLAIVTSSTKLDVECDGAPFHRDREPDRARDRDLKAAGWQVLRLSGRQIVRDLRSCVSEVLSCVRAAQPR